MARIELGSGRQTFRLERTGGSDRITDFRAQYFEATLDEARRCRRIRTSPASPAPGSAR